MASLLICTYGNGLWPGNRESALSLLAMTRPFCDAAVYLAVGNQDGAADAARAAGFQAFEYPWYPVCNRWVTRMIADVESLGTDYCMYLDLWERLSPALAAELPGAIGGGKYLEFALEDYGPDGAWLYREDPQMRLWARGSATHSNYLAKGLEPLDRTDFNRHRSPAAAITKLQPRWAEHLARYPVVRLATAAYDMRQRAADVQNVRWLQCVYPQVFTPAVVRQLSGIPYADEALMRPGTVEHEHWLRRFDFETERDPDDAVPADALQILQQVRAGAFEWRYPDLPAGWKPWPDALLPYTAVSP
jgi:hypothetical protein